MAFWGLSGWEASMWTPEDRVLVGDFGSGEALSDDQCRRWRRSPPAKPGGRPRTTDMRRLLDGLLCRAHRLPMAAPAAPSSFPPWPTVYGYFGPSSQRVSGRACATICRHVAGGEGREASPTAAIIDTQSVKMTEKGGPAAGGPRRVPRLKPVGKPDVGNRAP